jgi:hypothetical protein
MSIFSAGSKGQKSEFLEAFLSKFEVPHWRWDVSHEIVHNFQIGRFFSI